MKLFLEPLRNHFAKIAHELEKSKIFFQYLKLILLAIKFPFQWYIVCWGQFRSSKIIGGGGGGMPRITSISYSAKVCGTFKATW